jgi:hypothetical protein
VRGDHYIGELDEFFRLSRSEDHDHSCLRRLAKQLVNGLSPADIDAAGGFVDE